MTDREVWSIIVFIVLKVPTLTNKINRHVLLIPACAFQRTSCGIFQRQLEAIKSKGAKYEAATILNNLPRIEKNVENILYSEYIAY